MRRLLFIVALMMPWLYASASTNYAPHGFVNDFANIIPDDREMVLEQQLRTYEKKTSVELAVVTTPSLDGESIEAWSIALAQRWGIGKKDADNGLLLVVAPNEHEYRVEVGYGLEGIVPDATASRLSRTILPDAFRKNEYADGIEHLMSAFMTTIGYRSAEDRARIQAEQARLQAQQAERQKQQMAHFMYVVLIVLGIGVALVCVYVLIKRIGVYIEKRRVRNALRKKILAELTTHDVELSRLGEVEAHVPAERLPMWIQSNVQQHRASITQGREVLTQLSGQIKAHARFDPDEAQRRLLDFESDLERIQRHASILERIDMEIERFRMRVAKKVHEMNGGVEALTSTVRDMTTAGYHLDAIITPATLDEVTDTNTCIVKELVLRGRGVNDTSDKVLRKAKELKPRVHQLQASLDAMRDIKQHVDDALPELEARAKETTKTLETTRRLLAEIRSSAPEHVWKDVAQKFDGVPEMLTSASLLLASANESNSMQTQHFADAGESVAKAEHLLGRARDVCTSVQELNKHLREARHETPLAGKKTERAIAEAESVVTHSAVESDAHDKLTRAKKKLGEVRSLLSASPTDWLLALAGILAALALAESAKQLAEEDIARAKRKDEERKRRKAREEEESRRHSYATRSSGSRGSGGFGGFGGGSFGGGGASGKW